MRLSAIVLALFFFGKAAFATPISDRWHIYSLPENSAILDGGGKLDQNRERLVYILLGQTTPPYTIKEPKTYPFNGDWDCLDNSPTCQLFGIVRVPGTWGVHENNPNSLTFSAVVWNKGLIDDKGHTAWPHSQFWVRRKITDYLRENGIAAEIRYFRAKGVRISRGLIYRWSENGDVIVEVKEVFGIQTNVTFIRPIDYQGLNWKLFEHIYNVGKERLEILPQAFGVRVGFPISGDK